jgi:hypothetical protein
MRTLKLTLTQSSSHSPWWARSSAQQSSPQLGRSSKPASSSRPAILQTQQAAGTLVCIHDSYELFDMDRHWLGRRRFTSLRLQKCLEQQKMQQKVCCWWCGLVRAFTNNFAFFAQKTVA